MKLVMSGGVILLLLMILLICGFMKLFVLIQRLLYVECMYGYNEMIKYVNNRKDLLKISHPLLVVIM